MIYICTHTDFALPDGIGEGYKILSTRPLANEYTIPVEVVTKNQITPLQYAYAEGYHIFHMWKHAKDEWIGLNQYRKYFFDVPYGKTILPRPSKYNMHKQYAEAHGMQDLLDCESIINDCYPEYRCDYDALHLYRCNMFVMRRADFEQYCKFMFDVLGKFNEMHGIRTQLDVMRHIRENAKQYTYKHPLEYQSRLQGYLFERVGTIFFNGYFGITEKKIHFVSEKI